MQRDRWHRVHVRFCNILDDNGDVIVPSSNGLVVRGGDESSVVIDKGDGVDGSEMLVVSLHNLVCSCIILKGFSRAPRLTHLNDLFVGHSRHEDVLLVGIRVKFDDVRNLSIRKRLHTFAGFRVPYLDMPVIGCREEFGALVVESDVFDGLRMAQERPQTISFLIHIPQLHKSDTGMQRHSL